jgi:hypothetical protein
LSAVVHISSREKSHSSSFGVLFEKEAFVDFVKGEERQSRHLFSKKAEMFPWSRRDVPPEEIGGLISRSPWEGVSFL